MPPKTEQQKQLDELARQEAADVSPPVTNYGPIAPDIIKQHRMKMQEMEGKMTTEERKQYHGVRTSKYGYPPVK